MQLVKALNSKGFSITVAQGQGEFNRFLLQQGNDIACIIYDDLMYFCGAAAKEFKLSSIIFAQPVLHIKYKDLPTSGMGPLEPLLEICREIFNKRTASGVIINTPSCLESSSLSWMQQELEIPVHPLGPLHITSLENSSLLEEDRSCIEWLNNLGSKAQMETKEVLEMAWELYDSNQPFLWVISKSFPHEVSKMVSERGYIVKWAPQNELLAHLAVGSIVKRVPMICRPFTGEQNLNAKYIETVWGIGIQIQGEVERGQVNGMVKRLITDEEGAGMRDRSIGLKEKIKASMRSGGSSSYNALDELVNFLESEKMLNFKYQLT
ncbi:hypothetical protein EUTSA_v10002935mg [Eutrema salsugineum]|uniref:UDP-glycosyltransferases domain-containing protein n=1 Tax=Eutrema salsugineum TaxID=72664 RepID=V4KHJ2_EUTSA|nr:hypothetical protein EUTSA_v10002935mg [Eutrema salsugineum]